MVIFSCIGRKYSVLVCYLVISLLFACTTTTVDKTPSIANPPTMADNTPILVNDSAQEIKEEGFFSGKPCAPPCFWSIVPGTTTEKEAIKILKVKGIFQSCKSYDKEVQGGARGITCPSLFIVFQQGTSIVDSIGYEPSRKITVEDVISKYGEPDTIFVTEMGIPEAPTIGMSLHYHNIQTKLLLPEQEGMVFRAERSTPIENIVYSPSYNKSEKERIGDFLQDWKGYGEYQDVNK